MKLKVIKAELRPESDGKLTKKGRAYFFVESNPKINLNVARSLGWDVTTPSPDDYKAILKEALEMAGSSITKPFVSWSKTAGCSCGCSPGMIFEHEDLRGKELFVDVKIIQE